MRRRHRDCHARSLRIIGDDGRCCHCGAPSATKQSPLRGRAQAAAISFAHKRIPSRRDAPLRALQTRNEGHRHLRRMARDTPQDLCRVFLICSSRWCSIPRSHPDRGRSHEAHANGEGCGA
jgi:hypothetical protein